jgi:ribosomal protein S18 acetylase RimI-like enzyme
MNNLTLRAATGRDAEFVLDLSIMAAHGFLERFFENYLSDGDDLRALMLSRVNTVDSNMSWTKCWIAESDGQRAGMITLVEIPEVADPLDEELPSMFHPLAELEAMLPGGTIIEFVSTLPKFRGRGIATALLQHAHNKRSRGGLGLIVSNNNMSARKVYETTGFSEVARRPIVHDGWTSSGTEWILMTRP